MIGLEGKQVDIIQSYLLPSNRFGMIPNWLLLYIEGSEAKRIN